MVSEFNSNKMVKILIAPNLYNYYQALKAIKSY